MTFDTLLAVAIGIALSAAVGLRIFVPFLVMSVAARAGHLPLAPGFAWIASTPALAAFAVATIVEVTAYYVPWLDNLLDMLGPPVAIAAGILATASVVTDLPPLLKWSLAVIGGGGAAGILHGTTAAARAASTLTTGGAANFLLATVELAGAVVTSVLAILLPLVALLAAIVLAGWLIARRPGVPRPGASSG
ncbi:MAG: DUF4126 domain-containing protein [bacterium]